MLQALAPLILVVVVGLVLVVLIKAVTSGGGRGREFPYEAKELFTPAERSFFGVLEQAVAGRYRVLGKVRIGDLVKVKSGLEKGAKQGANNRIQSKHVDFVLCDPATLAVRCVVELDDKSHEKAERRERDEVVDKVFEAAGIPIHHFPAKRGYSPQELRDAIFGVERVASVGAGSLPAQR